MTDLVDASALHSAVEQLAHAVDSMSAQAGNSLAIRRLHNDVERLRLDAEDCKAVHRSARRDRSRSSRTRRTTSPCGRAWTTRDSEGSTGRPGGDADLPGSDRRAWRGAAMARAQSRGVGAPGRALVGIPTLRTDRWWRSPLITPWSRCWRSSSTRPGPRSSARTTSASPYISPFYSPCLAVVLRRDGRPVDLGIFGTWWPVSPAMHHPDLPARLPADLLLLPQGLLPGVLAVAAACAVPEPHEKYSGETRFPLILQNIHRYFF